MATTFTCERDGVVFRAETDDELITKIEHHVATSHPDLVGKLSRVDILDAATQE
jgi:hypothetical protein